MATTPSSSSSLMMNPLTSPICNNSKVQFLVGPNHLRLKRLSFSAFWFFCGVQGQCLWQTQGSKCSTLPRMSVSLLAKLPWFTIIILCKGLETVTHPFLAFLTPSRVPLGYKN
ncbi:hypothetical protein Tsubulata_024440, partial [Turnera subulata]